MKKTYLFEKEIRVFGIKRSGIHAISSWIYSHFSVDYFTNVIMLNNSDLSLKYHTTNKNNKKGNRPIRSKEILKFKISGKQRKKAFKFPLHALINIIENFDLESASKRLNNKKSSYNVLKKYYAKYYGFDEFSKEQFNILIYRSCFNQIASVLQYYQTHSIGKKGISSLQLFTKLCAPINYPLSSKLPMSFIDMKTQYELEALEVTNILKDKIIIFYDRWFVDIEYRKQIVKKLKLVFTDEGLNFIWRSHSSFHDIIDVQGQAQKMKVLDRYKLLENNFIGRKEIRIRVKEQDNEVFGK